MATKTTSGGVVAEIAAQMKRRGMTEYRLAQLAGIPAGTLNRILSGDRADPRLSSLTKLATAMGLRLVLAPESA